MAYDLLAAVHAALAGQHMYGGQMVNSFGNAIGETPDNASMVILPSGEGKYLTPDGREVPYPGTQPGGAQWNAEQARLANNAAPPPPGGNPFPGAANNFGLATPGTGMAAPGTAGYQYQNLPQVPASAGNNFGLETPGTGVALPTDPKAMIAALVAQLGAAAPPRAATAGDDTSYLAALKKILDQLNGGSAAGSAYGGVLGA